MALPLDSPRASTDRWLPVDAPIRGRTLQRGPLRLILVVDQFDVTNRPRYAPTPTQTWCNILVWDVTRALDCEIPHWTLPEGTPAEPGGGAHELDANATASWLAIHGARFGWESLGDVAATAGAWVVQGKPVVATYRAIHGHGHIAVLLPNLLFVSAGRRNHARGTLAEVFGGHPIQFWGHP